LGTADERADLGNSGADLPALLNGEQSLELQPITAKLNEPQNGEGPGVL
jgi:hypothetical protein